MSPLKYFFKLIALTNTLILAHLFWLPSNIPLVSFNVCKITNFFEYDCLHTGAYRNTSRHKTPILPSDCTWTLRLCFSNSRLWLKRLRLINGSFYVPKICLFKPTVSFYVLFCIWFYTFEFSVPMHFYGILYYTQAQQISFHSLSISCVEDGIGFPDSRTWPSLINHICNQ